MILRYNRRAVRDLEAIADYILIHNPTAAERVRNRIERLIDGLLDFPYQARQRTNGISAVLLPRPFRI
ncbi:MAG: type II toxin-antitoxin system RelE/ParE family toxin [Hyphomicrobium sp.]